MIYLAIDPGMVGAAAVYNPAASIASGLRWQLTDLPTIGEDAQRRINAAALRDWIIRFSPTHAFIELVHSMPKQGISSAFRFGRAAGSLDATVQCCGVPVTYIVPRVWKKFYGLIGPDKEQSRQKAIQLFPELSSALELKKSHGKAEAALLAAYGANLG